MKSRLSKIASKEEVIDYIDRTGYKEVQPGIWEMDIDKVHVDTNGAIAKARLLTETDDQAVEVQNADKLIEWYESKQMNGEV